MLQQAHASLPDRFPGSNKQKSYGYKHVPACHNAGVGTDHRTGE